jgi:YoeB-like toxin of bacterial type II toxin-antitoxin system
MFAVRPRSLPSGQIPPATPSAHRVARDVHDTRAEYGESEMSCRLTDFELWLSFDRKMARRITRLIAEIQRDPFSGIGKPEPLKGQLAVAADR